MKSLPKIAVELSTPIATLRYRLQAFEEFLPYQTSNRGKKEYTDAIVDVIRDINNYCNEKKSTEEIMVLLSAKFARDIEIVEDTNKQATAEQQDSFTELIRLNNNLELLIEKLDRQDEMRRDMQEMRTAIQELSRVERHKKWYKFW